jgi:CheY-like chemotaxis protein
LQGGSAIHWEWKGPRPAESTGAITMGNETNQAGRPVCILIAEDDAESAEMLALRLGLEGYVVHIASDGVAAIESAELHRPDIVLLDIGLPKMDGYEVARRLQQKRKPRKPLLIAITGHGQQPERLRAYEAGIDLHLTKPVSAEELLGLLGRFQATTMRSNG